MKDINYQLECLYTVSNWITIELLSDAIENAVLTLDTIQLPERGGLLIRVPDGSPAGRDIVKPNITVAGRVSTNEPVMVKKYPFTL